ncbi:TonB-dependent receptor domain-containing protein [Massilia cavernae]|uniref:TonB-dependent receptor domain-containing protein n=1 Tax=Massilia cavernae TaxID=2320864 RepID=UPI001E4D2EE5|nr:TonB-dependent receptor [Massilia cavernae]
MKADPATSNDTVADTLNKVPSLAVDPDGAVTVRGKSNVQILMDGKPSAMMQGDNRAAALNALPAADLESVEVINNPGAQFGNEGGGGPIINLVMRRERSPGGFAVVNANVGSSGRYNSSAFGSYTTGRMSVQGSLHRRHDGRDTSGETVRERIDPVTGAVSRSTQLSDGDSRNDSAGFNGSATYNLGERDVVGVSASYNEFTNDGDSLERYRSTGAGGVVDNEYDRTTVREAVNKNYSLGGRLDHKGSLPGEVFKLDLRLSGTDADSDVRFASRYAVRPPGALDSLTRQDNATDTRVADFTGDYERPLGTGLLKLGYKLARTGNSFDTMFFDTDTLTLAESVNRSRTNRFELDDTTVALYGSYQYRVDSQWSMLGGLRAEYNELDMHQVTTGIHATNSSTDLIPSAFVTYGLSDDTTLRLSYAHRIRRPNAAELNPFVIYRDELNVSSGNPNLKPSESDSLEIGMETKLGKVETNLRLYARHDTDLISERRLLLEDDVLLTTRENAGSSRSAGVEFTFSGRATDKLTLNASGNVGYSEQTVLGSANPGDGRRSAVSVTGRARVGYQIDAKNNLQLSLNAQGKQLFGEGYRKPTNTADLSYRRNLTQALSFVLNISDLFDSQKIETVTETASLREQSLRRFNGRVVFAGLSYRFGSFAGGRGPGGPGGPGRAGPGFGGGPPPGR